MQQVIVEQKQEQRTILDPDLPLAIYREFAAHLCQIRGVEVELLPQDSPHFRYRQSQIAGLRLSYASNLDDQEKARLEAIVNFYGQKSGKKY